MLAALAFCGQRAPPPRPSGSTPQKISTLSRGRGRSPSNSSDIAYPPVQLVHGTEDPVVPFVLMQEAQTILGEKGIEVETVTRPGLAHGIDPDGLTASIDFLARHLPV